MLEVLVGFSFEQSKETTKSKLLSRFNTVTIWDRHYFNDPCLEVLPNKHLCDCNTNTKAYRNADHDVLFTLCFLFGPPDVIIHKEKTATRTTLTSTDRFPRKGQS